MESLASDASALSIHRHINRTAVAYPGDRGVKELFEEVAERLPDAPAIIHRDRTLSYRELNQAANGLAAALRQKGVAPGASVAVSISRSPELITALLAIIKCGAVYVPVDASWPDGRLQWIFKETRCGHIITDETENFSQRFPAPYALAPVAEPSPHDPEVATQPDDIAYVNFTSGSTGKPKGVPIRHRGIARLVFNSRYARLDERTTLIQLAPVSFDAATFEIWGGLLHGGTCVLYPAKRVRLSELKRTLDTHRVTVIFLTTALFNTVVDEGPATLDSVETILTGGEAHSMRHIREAVARYGPNKVVNVYGPTECTTFATFHPLSLDALPDEMLDLPIGFPIQNTRLYLVEEGELCPPGRIGEVCLAGPGLSPGYLGMQEVTRERFVDCEIDGIRERLYRTGDRGYFLADGNLVFQGRLDDQVKINGFRIELGEIAHHLDRHPLVRLSYVTVGESSIGEKVLTAFVVPRSDRCTAADITDYLRIHLPGYLIPTKIHLRDSLPLSATGKVDREALLKSTEPTPGKFMSLSKSARKFQDLLHERGLDLTVVELPSSTRTADDAARSLGCEKAQIVKSLVFRKTATDEAVIVLASGPNRVNEQAIAALVGSEIGKADADFVKASTGYSIGGVPPLGHKNEAVLFVDEDLLGFEEVWAAAGTPHAVFKISGKITEILPEHTVTSVQ